MDMNFVKKMNPECDHVGKKYKKKKRTMKRT